MGCIKEKIVENDILKNKVEKHKPKFEAGNEGPNNNKPTQLSGFYYFCSYENNIIISFFYLFPNVNFLTSRNEIQC